MTAPLITVDGITVRLRDRWLLSGLTWRINTGEQWAIIGPNGAGKTTLAKAIAGLLPVVQGKIHYHTFGGIPPTDVIAYVASDARRDLWRRERDRQHASAFAGRFDEATTARELIELSFGDRGLSAADRFHLADVTDRFGLQALLDRPAMAISTGEMCRLEIVREMVRRPRMLILDEPFEGLDQPSRHELLALFHHLAASGLPIVTITHRADEILPATTHVLTIEAGRMISAGPLAKHQPLLLPARATRPAAPERYRPVTPRAQGSERRRSGHPPLIDMQSVTVRYGGVRVLDRFSWTVGANDHWAVTGPNGAGKSTLLKLITGECLQVYANRIRLFGKDRGVEQDLWEIRAKLGVVSHDLAVAYQKHMSTLDVVCSGFFGTVGLYRHCDDPQRKTAAEWLARLGMAGLSGVPFNQLSQGQRQMVLIARAMVKAPHVLILDEPCAGLDPDNRQMVLAIVEQIGRKGATRLIFVSHDDNDIPGCTTHRLRMDRGRVVYSGPID
jgi:molybdate transport system ATP-binding protein